MFQRATIPICSTDFSKTFFFSANKSCPTKRLVLKVCDFSLLRRDESQEMRTAFWRMDPQGGLENRWVLFVTRMRDVFSRAVACERNFCKQSLGGYKEITLSICLSVHLYDCAILSSPYLSYWKKIIEPEVKVDLLN